MGYVTFPVSPWLMIFQDQKVEAIKVDNFKAITEEGMTPVAEKLGEKAGL